MSSHSRTLLAPPIGYLTGSATHLMVTEVDKKVLRLLERWGYLRCGVRGGKEDAFVLHDVVMIELCKESGQEEEYAHPWRNAVLVATIENLRGELVNRMRTMYPRHDPTLVADYATLGPAAKLRVNAFFATPLELNNVNEFMARFQDPTIIQAMLDLQAAKKLNPSINFSSPDRTPAD